MTLKPPPLSNDCFALPSGVDWTPVDVALSHLRRHLHVIADIETIPLDTGLGRILATPLAALRAHPPLANAAVDGYGFAYQSLGQSPHRLPLAQGRAAAGQPFAGALPPGQALRILTGASLPKGMDTIVLAEDTSTDGAQIAFQGPLKHGANTRQAGEDCQEQDHLFPAGHILRAQDLALLAATGHAKLTVRKRLKVGVLSTGDEVVPHDQVERYDQIPDANGPMLRALITGWHMDPIPLGHASDDKDSLRVHLDDACQRCDAILTSGGASTGDEDHLSALLQAHGHHALWRIAIKPGRPLGMGLWQGCPLFTLPGNPVAAFVTALIFARPALSLLAGAGWQEPRGYTLPAAFDKQKKAGRREYLRARVRDGQLEVFGSEGSGRISGLSWSDGLVELPDAAQTIQRGTMLRYLPYAELFSLFRSENNSA